MKTFYKIYKTFTALGLSKGQHRVYPGIPGDEL